MLKYSDLHTRALTAALLIRRLIEDSNWQLFVQPPGGSNRGQNWRGYLVDEHGAVRKDISFRTLDLLTAEGYLRRYTVGRMWSPHGREWRGSREPIPVDVYVVTYFGREAYRHPLTDVAPRLKTDEKC